MANQSGTANNDILNGTTAADNIKGLAGDDTIYGYAGNDIIDGGAGDDTMYGGLGNDTYTVDSTDDIIVEFAGEGTDLVKSSVDHFLEANVENLTLTGTAYLGVGNELNNIIIGTSGNNLLDGGIGADTMNGGAGNDSYYVDNIGDKIIDSKGVDSVAASISYTLQTGLENLYLTGSDNLNGTGNAAVNILAGNDGDNTLNGMAGADTMIGGLGNDTYIIDNANDKVSEDGGAGTDTILTSVTHTMEANVENMTLTGTAAINGFGNDLDNVIIGNSGVNSLSGGFGNDTLDGGAGADKMSGGLGDDTYYVDNAGDTITEGAGEGIDTVITGLSHTLAANVDNLILTGVADINGTGNDLDNTITGNSGNNTLDGKAGDDHLIGGLGNDVYIVDSINDVIVENAGEGTDTVLSSVSHVLQDNVENLTLTGTDDISGQGNTLDNVITGNSGNNVLNGDAGNDTLDGGAGVDTMLGGTGDDVYKVDSSTDMIIEGANEGTDVVISSASFVLGDNVENLILTGSANLNGTGNSLDNTIFGNSGNNIIDGGAGADLMQGGLGNDTYMVDNASDHVSENAGEGTDTIISMGDFSLAVGGVNVENLTLQGVAYVGIGNELNNNIIGNSLDNYIDGGAGADVMSGGLGNDVYIVDNINDIVVERASEGTDIVNSSVSYTLSANIEQLTLTGTGNINGIGNSGDNVLTGNTGDNTLNGMGGNDTMIGGGGNDTFIVDSALDAYTGGTGIDTVMSSVVSIDLTSHAEIENATLTGTGNLDLTANAIVNILTGNDGSNVLDGAGGADTMIGGKGDDAYYVDDINDVITELANGGVDSVYVRSGNYTLGANIENLTLLGGDNGHATGNDLNNYIAGDSSNNVIDGGAGQDYMIGGLGDDTYVVDNAGDTVLEFAGEGTDTVQASVSYTLGSNIENLTLTGMADLTGTGNTGDNTIIGNSGFDTLIGGGGNDTLDASAGSGSVLVVDSASDYVIGGNGFDTVKSSVSWDLNTHSTSVENIVLTGNANINATGDSGFNNITGNAGNNLIDGGSGPDQMAGGAGDDTYMVDDAEDAVIEHENEGIDTVITSSFAGNTLGANVENLKLIGGVTEGYGNELDNVITGNQNGYNNTLNGFGGADTMIGGTNNNDFYVDNVGDSVVGNGGIDTVHSSITYSIASQALIENIILTGSDNINATGNAGNNTLIGNDGNNVLQGGGGTDTLIGGAGDDTYYMNTGVNIIENADSGTDTVHSSISYILGANLENLILDVSTDEYASGNALNNIITGGAGNNYIDGGEGADTMIGLAGNDTYIVDDEGDVVIEAAGGGTADQVNASISYILGANVENLQLDGSNNLNGTGNELNNTITGNSGSNTLDGKAGADVMIGGGGDDTFIIDNAGDSFTGGSGIDTVKSSVISVDISGHAEIENAALDGTANLNLTGNGGNNFLSGNAGSNIIDGGTGTDIMYGNGGNDTFIVDSVGDFYVGGTGIDTVKSSVISIDLSSHTEIENATLTGTASLNLTGNALNNVLTGNSSDNIIDGNGGIDTLIGGAGNDQYFVDSQSAVVTENAGEGNDAVTARNASYTMPANVEFLAIDANDGGTYTGTGSSNADTLYAYGSNSSTVTLLGGAGNDTLYSYDSSNSNVTLDGGTGADTMTNSAISGVTTFVVDDAGDVVVAKAGLIDYVRSSLDSYTLGTDADDLALTGSARIGNGNALNNFIIGNDNDNTLDGGAGDDFMVGGSGNDTYYVDSLNDTVYEYSDSGTNDSVIVSAALTNYTLALNVERLTMLSNADVIAIGNDNANNIITGNGNDSLDGGLGADVMSGGLGNDTYFVDDAGDQIFEGASAGTDVVIASVSYTLSQNVENLTLALTAGSINATGNADNNILTGNNDANTLDGGGGTDTLIGGSGNDTYIVRSLNDVVTEDLNGGVDTVRADFSYTLGTNVENLVLTGTGDINGTGNGTSNVITGNAGANTLDGAIGADTMIGLAGNDTYVVDNDNDKAVEVANGGTDTVLSSAYNYTLNDYVENLILTGTDNLHGTGNALVNTLIGNSGDNYLDGKAGADTMIGGLGNDIYFVDNAKDVVIEATGEGNDIVISSVTYTLTAGSEIENLYLDGSARINGTGNAIDNYIGGNAAVNSLYGMDGNDTLDGGGGADLMVGGNGNDTYYVDVTNDRITETATGGVDRVFSTVTYTLAAYVENLTLVGSDNINGIGNTLDNHLVGNEGNNTLDGKAGADIMEGGDGNDTYIVDNAGDVVTEDVNHGTDTVVSSVNWLLGANIENLTLTGKALIGAGNDLDNTLTGNSLANTLDGGLGADHMIGGAGNDTYYVDNAGDTIVDTSGTKDLVHASIDYTLGSTIENLTLDTGAHVGTGNALANTIIGNDDGNSLYGLGGADKLFGGLDDDILDGGAGVDTLTGGGGTDTFVFHASEATSAANADRIMDFTAGTGAGHDVIDIHDILQGHGYTSGSVSDYVHLTVSGGNTILSVDADGLTGGSHFVNIATIVGLQLTDANVLVTDGNLIVT